MACVGIYRGYRRIEHLDRYRTSLGMHKVHLFLTLW